MAEMLAIGDGELGLVRSVGDGRFVVDEAGLAALVEALFPEALGVWLFGSFALSDGRRDSDIDLALLTDQPLPKGWGDSGPLGQLSLRANRDVDLIDLRRVPLALQFEVLNRGRRIAARDARRCDHYELHAIALYQQHWREQRPRFADIVARGRVS